ncbi:unnamed protein product [Symbiodinium microadriaticum]|nr:unnamed protein product [Symbiodinium microadriaticum]
MPRWGKRGPDLCAEVQPTPTPEPLDLSASKVAGYIGRPAACSQGHLFPGCTIADSSGKLGQIEFVPRGSSEEVLVQYSQDPQDLAALRWTGRHELRVVDATTRRSTERADVRAYREALRAIRLRSAGQPVEEIAEELGRPTSWVRQRMDQSPATLQKPKGMEWWDAEGFCEVTYLRGYARQPGLYEDIVATVDWEQDKVWRVRKQEGNANWHLRTVKECPGLGRGFCGRSLQKVPDDTHQIGPRDVHHAAKTRPHGNWYCSMAQEGCQKPQLASPLQEPYWWCSKCSWYCCDACVQRMPDKATSKQVAQWRPGASPQLDALVADVVKDFNLPDPFQAGYTIKMNWYPDALSRVSPHRHDNWTLLISLGAPRVLSVDRAQVLMEDGDLILFGTQSHGVPEMPSAAGGRLSLVFMFAPDQAVGSLAEARARAGGATASRAGAAPAGMPKPRCALRAEELQLAAYSASWQDGYDDWADTSENRGEVEGAALQALCAMGFSEEQARASLLATEGDTEQAVSLLLSSA